MPPMIGTSLVLQVNTGTVAVPVWVTVGSQRESSISEEVDTIDVSSKDAPEQAILPGRYSSTVSLDHLYVPGAPEQAALATAIQTRILCQLRRFEAGVAGKKASGYVTSREESFPDMEESVVSVEFTVSGAWVAG